MNDTIIGEVRQEIQASNDAIGKLHSRISWLLSEGSIVLAKLIGAEKEVLSLKERVRQLEEIARIATVRAETAEICNGHLRAHQDACHQFLMLRGGLQGEDMSVRYAGRTLLERLKILLGEKP